ncbi:MAG: helix-turn-helix domain-containing protein [Chitinivibrionales bacterium]|nr:helix-turn-helix domain-containing protein [Chitinivibrionales bacterium]
MDNKIMTMEEVAEFLRVSVRTVYEWAHKGEIPCGKIGTVWRFKRSEIEQWVDERLVASHKSVAPPSISVRDIFSPQRIAVLDSITKVEAFNHLVDIISTSSCIRKKKELSEEIFKRESLMSTALGLGVGVPHVRLGSVKDLVAAVGISPVGIMDYESLDNIPVFIIVMVAGNRKQHSEFLRLLSYLSSLIKHESIREKLVTSNDPYAIYDVLAGGIGAHFHSHSISALKNEVPRIGLQ